MQLIWPLLELPAVALDVLDEVIVEAPIGLDALAALAVEVVADEVVVVPELAGVVDEFCAPWLHWTFTLWTLLELDPAGPICTLPKLHTIIFGGSPIALVPVAAFVEAVEVWPLVEFVALFDVPLNGTPVACASNPGLEAICEKVVPLSAVDIAGGCWLVCA